MCVCGEVATADWLVDGVRQVSVMRKEGGREGSPGISLLSQVKLVYAQSVDAQTTQPPKNHECCYGCSMNTVKSPSSSR